MSSLDVLLELGLVSELSAAVFDGTDELFLGHIVEKHVYEGARLLNCVYLKVLVCLLFVNHDTVAVGSKIHETSLYVGEVLWIDILVACLQ